MNAQTLQDQALLCRVREYAGTRGIRGVRWGFVLRSTYDPSGELRYQVSTLAGETMYLTHGLLLALPSVIVQGEAFGMLSALDSGEASDPVDTLLISLWLGEPGSESKSAVCLAAEYQMGRGQPLVCLLTAKPEGWPA